MLKGNISHAYRKKKSSREGGIQNSKGRDRVGCMGGSKKQIYLFHLSQRSLRVEWIPYCIKIKFISEIGIRKLKVSFGNDNGNKTFLRTYCDEHC